MGIWATKKSGAAMAARLLNFQGAGVVFFVAQIPILPFNLRKACPLRSAMPQPKALP